MVIASMNKFFKNILTHRSTYTYLSFSCILFIVVYTAYRAWNWEVVSFGLLIMFLIILLNIGSVIVIYEIVKKGIKEDYENGVQKCEECAADTSKYQFANFDFLTFEDLIAIENSLSLDEDPKKCYVYIYTSDISTEDDAEEVVIENIKAGVNYKVFYIDGTPTESQIALYKKENLFKCDASEIDRSADFDIMIYIDSERKANGYFCVNFSKIRGPRPCSQGFKCPNECHYENENLLYKKIRSDTLELLLSVLKEKEKKDEQF